MVRPTWHVVLVALAGLTVIGTSALLVLSYSRSDGGPGSSGDSGYTASTGLTRVDLADRASPITLQGETLTGDTLDTGSWRGSVVVVNVWGSWCAPCRAEAPDLVKVYEATRDDAVEFVGIDVRDQVAPALSFTEEFGIEYPSFFDQASSLLLSFSGSVPVSAVPSTVVLDQEGRVGATVIGVVDQSTLTGLIEDLLLEGRAHKARASP